jgi:hypothetical protein
MTRARFLPSVVLASCLFGCGGEDEGRPSGERGEVTPLDPCEADDGFEFQNIVNFEPRMVGDRLVTTAACDAEIPCSFYFNYDDAQSQANPTAPTPREKGALCLDPVDPDAVVSTQPFIEAGQLQGEPLQGGRCAADSSGLHVITQNVGMCYGPNGRLGWGAALDITFTVALDASEWDGISFWIKNGSQSKQAVILSVADQYTGGPPYCDNTGATDIPDTAKCDSFGVAVTLDPGWTFIPGIFASMRQKGFGVPSEHGQLDKGTISRAQILMSAGSFEFWLDDFALFRLPDP